MKRGSEFPRPGPGKQSITEALDTLNAQTRVSRDAPNRLRRNMEARIEAAAKRRRSREAGAASKVKSS